MFIVAKSYYILSSVRLYLFSKCVKILLEKEIVRKRREIKKVDKHI